MATSETIQWGTDGFTLIELLVVIAIIGLLASIVLVALDSARAKARVSKRLADMQQIANALELYYNDNNAYPTTSGSWRSQCPGDGGYAANQVIPGLVPTYMSTFPADPAMGMEGVNTNCYLYKSNGTDYKFMIYNLTDMSMSDVLSNQYVDPYFDSTQCGNSNPDVVAALSVSTSGGRCWN